MSLTGSILFLLYFLVVPGELAYASASVHSAELTIHYEEGLQNLAREVMGLYPLTRAEVTDELHLNADFRPEVVFIRERRTFRKISGSDVIVAFAVPERNLIVMDASRVYEKPFTLETTLKHELCHLVLHRNISRENLPRWFDEGVCQWSTGGIAELMGAQDDKSLANAVISHNLIGLAELQRFPADTKSMILAYEESKSAIEYIMKEYGRKRFIGILRSLEKGEPMEVALQNNLSEGLYGLESKWRDYLERKYTWFAYLSSNLYTLIFLFGAIITVYGFIRLLRRKKEYTDEEG